MLPSRSKSLSVTSAPRGPTLMEGPLEKKKTFGSSKFYCSLRDGKLFYSEDKGRENSIDISHAQAVRDGKAKFSFEIITSSRTHIFVADSQTLRDKWITSLREMMRISSRKNSTLSYIESANSDEENGATAAPHSPIESNAASGARTSKPPISPLKPGFASSLPIGFTKRASASDAPSVNKEMPKPHRTSEMTSKSVSALESPTKPCSKSALADDEASKGRAAAVSHGAENEIKEERSEASTHITLPGDGEKKAGRPSVSSNCISEETESGALSEDDNGEKERPTRCSNGVATVNDSPATNPIDTINQQSLYANSVDMQLFLNEQKVEPEQMTSASRTTYANKSDMEKFLKVEDDQTNSVSTSKEIKSHVKGRNEESTSKPELQSRMDTARDKEDVDESDDVFSLPCNPAEEKHKTEEVKPPVKPVMRRPSQLAASISSFATDVPEPETEAVELDAGFCHESIPDLPHPRLEKNWSSAFDEIRAMLSISSTQNDSSALTSVFKEQQGHAVDSLKHFLKNVECG